jgi:hypothetical protein
MSKTGELEMTYLTDAKTAKLITSLGSSSEDDTGQCLYLILESVRRRAFLGSTYLWYEGYLTTEVKVSLQELGYSVERDTDFTYAHFIKWG